MSSSFVVWLFKLIGRLPLSVLHMAGSAIGWLTYRLSAEYAARMRENLAYALPQATATELRKVLSASITESGKGLTELPWVWCRPLAQVTGSVRECHGWEFVEAAILSKQGIIFLTPHLGCFDVSALYLAERMPITILYRPPKLAWLEQVMCMGRERAQVKLARTDVSGVRLMYKALKRGEAIGLLPDQVPGNGEGEWVDFFGHPAYTMTLVERLAGATKAAVIILSAERLPHGAGYRLRFSRLDFEPNQPVTRQINAAVETTVLGCPEQYLWSYNRYKTPPGAGGQEPGQPPGGAVG